MCMQGCRQMQWRMVTAGHVQPLVMCCSWRAIPASDFISHAGKQPDSASRLFLLHCRPCAYICAHWLRDAAAGAAHVAPFARMTAHGVSIESLSDDELGRLFMLLPQGDRCHACFLGCPHGAQVGS